MFYYCDMNLAAWTRADGVRLQTVYRWFHQGTMPAPGAACHLVRSWSPRPAVRQADGVLYPRVSWTGDRRPRLQRFADPRVTIMVRSTSIGWPLRCGARRGTCRRGQQAGGGWPLARPSHDLVRDMIDAFTGLSGRLNGRGAARNRELTCASKPPGHADTTEGEDR